MRKFGYSEVLATGVIAGGGTLGIMIPLTILVAFPAISLLLPGFMK